MKKKMKKIMAGFLSATLAVTSLTVPAMTSSAKFVPETASLGRQAAAEGIVMLENKEEVLPFHAGQEVSVFGRCQIDTFFFGYGSGSAPGGPYAKVSILEGIKKNPSIQYNKDLAEEYTEWCANHVPSGGSWGNWPYYYDEMPVTDEMVQKASESSDTAMVVIGRAAGEDRECRLEAGSYYLTEDEKALLSKVNQNFDKIVVLLNVGNLIDMSWLGDYENIKSVLYVWQGGLEMGNAVADILSGDVTPSGKLADTIAREYKDYPASSTFAWNDGNVSTEVYNEDIYVGYRYFETFAKDRVLYPFGYGMSYTTFDTEATVEADDENITVTATVTNTGDTYSGKEVVEVYYAAPQGKLGKPARALAGYAKTNEIAPGASQTVKVTFPVENMAFYDDSGLSGYDSAWVLEAGDYDIYVGNSVRAAKKAGTWTLTGGTRLVEQLEEASAPHQSFERLKPAENEDGTYTKVTEEVPTVTEEADLASRVLENLPEAVEQTEDKGIQLIDVYNGTHTMDEFIAQLTVEELAAISRGDWGQGSKLVPASSNASAFGGVIQSLRDKGIPAVSTHDGPAGPKVGTTGTGLPIGTMLACTWNDVLIEKLCYYSGCEMDTSQADVWLAPGMNIHRDPLGGRNFEYFSEDPVLTGQMGSAATRGMQNAGVSVMPKHYAVNSQETNRHWSDSVVSERAQREIYLRGFEICVKTAKPYNLMASYNKINGEWSHYNYDTATTILRNDWGFEGALHTDWWLRQDTSEELGGVSDNAYRIRAQVDVNEPGEGPGTPAREDTATIADYQKWVDAGKPMDHLEGLTLGEMQRTARNVLNVIMDSRVFRAAHNLENRYAAGEPWFTVQGIKEETKPLLDDLTIEGMDFTAFDPSTSLYEVFWQDMDEEFPTVNAQAAGAQVTVVQASREVPAATITVNKDGGKSIYRVIFTSKAGLTPVVKDPVLAKVTGIQIDGRYIQAFYPTIYTYNVEGNVETADIQVDVPSGVISSITRDTEKYTATIRAESKDQAVEYVLKFPKAKQKAPVSDNFDDGVLNEEIWQVLRPTDQLSEKDGTLNIQTEQGEWYGKGAGKNTMNNIVYQEAGGNWEATVKLIIPSPASLIGKDTNQFGIAVYDDPDNYVDMNYVTVSWSSDKHMLQVRNETAGTCNDQVSSSYGSIKKLPVTEKWTEKESVTIWMRVKRVENQYTFSVKTETMEANGEDFAVLGVTSAEFQNPKIGLYASRGNSNAATSLVKFDDFQVTADDGRPQSDTFDGTALSSFWTVDRMTDKLSVSDGSMNIQTESGEWYGSNEDSWPIRNMPYQSAKGNWTATVELVVPKPADLAGKNCNQFGISIFEDSDNYVDANYCTASWNSQFLQVRHETAGVCDDTVSSNYGSIKSLPITENWASKDQVTLWLRVKKEGSSYTFYVLTEDRKAAGNDFAVFGQAEATYSNPKLGLYATLGKDAGSSLVKFNDLTITDYEAAPEPEPEPKEPVEVSKAGESRVMAVADALLLSSRLKAESCSDPEASGQDLGYGNNGDYAVYAIQVKDAGYYKISTRVASGESNELAQLRHDVEIDGEVAVSYVHTTTHGWQNWIPTDAGIVYLEAGRHMVRFVYGSQINFNFIRFIPCTEEESDQQAVTEAKAVIEGMTARQLKVEQTAANTASEIQSWLAEKINTLLTQKESLKQSGIRVQETDITIFADSFQAAEEGSRKNPQGVNGSYKFTAALGKGESSIVTEVRSGSILATAYQGGTDDSLEAARDSLQDLYDTWAEADLSIYTKDSAASLEKALEEAKAVLDKEDASQKELTAATTVLMNTIGSLEYDVQKVHLETAIAFAEKLLVLENNYDNTDALKAAIAAGKAVLADDRATQAEADDAAYEILDELAKLAKKADVNSLESLIEAAESILSDKYTADSAEKLEEAIENGKAVLADPEREEHAVKDSYEAVIDAVAGLQMKGSKAALKAMLAKANQVISNAGAYVAGTIEGLEAVTADAQAVYDEVDALQDEVDEAVRALTLKVAQARLLGDVDGNGTVTTADGAAVLRSAAELDRLSDEAAASADVNRDGAVDTDDAVKILQYTAEKIAAF